MIRAIQRLLTVERSKLLMSTGNACQSAAKAINAEAEKLLAQTKNDPQAQSTLLAMISLGACLSSLAVGLASEAKTTMQEIKSGDSI